MKKYFRIQFFWLVTSFGTRKTSKYSLNIEFSSVMLQALVLIFQAYPCNNFKRIKGRITLSQSNLTLEPVILFLALMHSQPNHCFIVLYFIKYNN